jgi:hypothetical protein
MIKYKISRNNTSIVHIVGLSVVSWLSTMQGMNIKNAMFVLDLINGR